VKKEPSFGKVLIVGLGLIGGSIGLALTDNRVEVRGVTRSVSTLEEALRRGAITGGSTRLEDEAPHADLIILAAPTRTSINLITDLAQLAKKGTVITDVCSSKVDVVRAMNQLPRHLRAVGGHPMAGKETPGISAAEKDLFLNSRWVLTETKRSDQESKSICEELAKLCGANVLWLDAEEHDLAVAYISHLPLLTSAALVLAAEEADTELTHKLAATGFRDSTRLAAGDHQMGVDLILTNSRNILQAINMFAHKLQRMADAIEAGDEGKLRSLLEEAANIRRNRYYKDNTH